MGFALITTLLGIIVSIILNLSSTEVSSYFNRRLDRIAEKSDELRFRLMELVMRTEDTLLDAMPPELAVPAIQSPIAQGPALHAASQKTPTRDYVPEPVAHKASTGSGAGRAARDVAPAKEDKEPAGSKRATEKEPVQKARPSKVTSQPVQNNVRPIVDPSLQQEAKSIAQVEAVFQDRFSNNNYGDSAATEPFVSR